MTSNQPGLWELFAGARQNPILTWTTRGRGFRAGFYLFLLLLIAAMASSLAVARELVAVDKPEAVGGVGLAIYSLFMPFMLALAIPLSARPVSLDVRREVCLTGLSAREVAFGVLLPPLVASLAVVLLFPALLVLMFTIIYPAEMLRFPVGVVLLHTESLQSLAFILAVGFSYGTFSLSAVHVPLLARVRPFSVAWAPILIAPIWGLGHVFGITMALMVVMSEVSSVVHVVTGERSDRIDLIGGLLSLLMLAATIGLAVWTTWHSVTNRAGIRWMGEAVPEAAADFDWAYHDRLFAGLSPARQKAAWKEFWHEAWLWWRSRLKWAAGGVLVSFLPAVSSLTISGFGEYRLLEMGAIFLAPFLIPAFVFLPEMMTRRPGVPPILAGRLLPSTLILFVPLVAFFAICPLLVLLIEHGTRLFTWYGLVAGIFEFTFLALFVMLPGYCVWLMLLPRESRALFLRLISVAFALFVPSAMGIWTLLTLPGLLLVGALLVMLIGTAFLGLISIHLQRLFMGEGRGVDVGTVIVG